MTTEQKPKKLKRVLFSLLGVIIVLLAAAAIMIQLRPAAEPPAPTVEEPDFHENADAATPLVVNFAIPATTVEEYEQLYDAITGYVTSYSAPETQKSVVSVTEDTFIDREDASDPYVSEAEETYTEYDRSYFDDFLMVRYVSQSGTIHVVGARFGGTDGTTIELINQEDFVSDHFSAVEIVEEEEASPGWKFWERTHEEVDEEIEKEMETKGSISEDSFIICIGQCILQLLAHGEDEERILSHFTDEGVASLLRIAQVFEVGDSGTVNILLAEAGATEPGLDTMNRMYVRCELTDGGESVYLNLLLKLNGNLLVYDVDLI